MLARLFLFVLPLIICTATAVQADDLDVDLSKPDVQLNVSFKGSELLLFGAKDLFGDVIVVVRGPLKDTSVRLKQQIMGVWANTDEVVFADAPAFYALAASQPVEDLLDPTVLKAERIGTHYLGLKAKTKPDGATQETVQDFTDGLIRNMIRKSLYTDERGKIGLIGKQLFRTDLWFPANVSVGEYTVDTYLIVNKQVESKKTTYLNVHKVGVEAQVYDFAHEHALIYGLLAIVIAMVSGWAANAVFMKRGR